MHNILYYNGYWPWCGSSMYSTPGNNLSWGVPDIGGSHKAAGLHGPVRFVAEGPLDNCKNAGRGGGGILRMLSGGGPKSQQSPVHAIVLIGTMLLQIWWKIRWIGVYLHEILKKSVIVRLYALDQHSSKFAMQTGESLWAHVQDIDPRRLGHAYKGLSCGGLLAGGCVTPGMSPRLRDVNNGFIYC